MFLRIAMISGLAMIAAAAQDKTPTGSIGGMVLDDAKGLPLASANIFLDPLHKSAKTDANGHYEITGLPPGVYTIGAYSETFRGPHGTKSVSLAAGQSLTVDFRLSPIAEIRGRILDENDEPVSGAEVFLVAREYRLGALRYVYAGMTPADDRGQYVLPYIAPGRGVLLVAKKRRVPKLDAISDAPTDPKLRKKTTEPTWYPDTDTLDGAQVLILRPGEHREGIDIRMRRSASYCMDGVLPGDNGPGPLRFGIEEREPASGESGDGGMFVSPLGGQAGADGKFRVCDLHPGVYRLLAYQVPGENTTGSSATAEGPMFFGETEETIGDKDLHNVRLVGHARVSVSGEVVWDAKPPDHTASDKLSIELRPITRAPFGQEVPHLRTDSAVPGDFTFPELLVDNYSAKVSRVPSGAYVKEITYGGLSVLHEPVQVGKTIGSTLRIVLARDGGTVSVKVQDKDGNPVADCKVVLLPADATTEAALAAAMVSGQTDQNGAYTSGQLAPGKYSVLATNDTVDFTPETIARLSQARTHAKDIELPPNDALQITLSPLNMG